MCDTLIVIVNYRTAGLVEDCLASLEADIGRMGSACVVVVDADSQDGSAERLAQVIAQRGWSGWVTFDALPTNGGFAYGNNEAIRRWTQDHPWPDTVVLLNPDTVVRPGALPALLAFMDRTPAAAIAGSRLEDPDGTPQRSAFRFHSLRSEINDAVQLGPVSRWLKDSLVAPPPPETIGCTDWVAGACMAIRKEVCDAIGLLDERYFMYYEEVDFCKRAANAGYQTWYCPEARVVHLIGQASGVTDHKAAPKRRPAYWFESRRRYMLRHLGPLKTFVADVVWVVAYPLRRLRHAVMGRPLLMPPYLWRDFVRHNLLMPKKMS